MSKETLNKLPTLKEGIHVVTGRWWNAIAALLESWRILPGPGVTVRQTPFGTFVSLAASSSSASSNHTAFDVERTGDGYLVHPGRFRARIFRVEGAHVSGDGTAIDTLQGHHAAPVTLWPTCSDGSLGEGPQAITAAPGDNICLVWETEAASSESHSGSDLILVEDSVRVEVVDPGDWTEPPGTHRELIATILEDGSVKKELFSDFYYYELTVQLVTLVSPGP